ncbi:DNA gyrase inhibitor YacG [Jeongeupia sp. USM3]|uniref:DNA gyrase inhibitor YacG n=1 Tax=Jeongeupia sp. USM3 TaxID=1906741 RepID=UPI000A96AD57|nr:DNA gyrase inhibitor YacG [Jeongeupia sp. USM3]
MNQRIVPCPQCGEPAVYSPDNAFRPFCSRRCRLIDLGQWADESYRIPAADPAKPDVPTLDA